MPMFDIEDCTDVELEGNKTNQTKLAKLKNVEGFKAKDNEVKTSDVEAESLPLNACERTWQDSIMKYIIVGVFIAVISGLILYALLPNS
jgi:hypothetical protein